MRTWSGSSRRSNRCSLPRPEERGPRTTVARSTPVVPQDSSEEALVGADGRETKELEFRDSLTEMDSRFRGNDGQTATASLKATCLAEMTSFPRKRESIA